MALSRYVLTATVTVPAGTPAADANGFGLATFSGPAFPATFIKGTAIMLDPAGSLYTAIGAGNLRAWSDGEAVGHARLAN